MRTAFIAAAMLTAFAAPASACLPPPVVQTETDRLRPAFERSTDIVYGVVTRGARANGMARFRVLHVYRGNLVAGQVIAARPSDGFDPLPCLGLIQARPPRAYRGQYGVIAFQSNMPVLNFLNRNHVDLAMREGWIVSAGR